MQVYKRKKQQKTLPHKTPVTKSTGHKSLTRVLTCIKCDFKCTDIGIFYNHKKKEHGKQARKLSKASVPQEDTARNPLTSLKVFAESPKNDFHSPLFKFHCMRCGSGFMEEADLSSHEREKHEWQCLICDQSFYTKFDHDLHVVTAYSFSKIYTPGIFSAAFR